MRAAEKASVRYGIKIALAPPLHMSGLLAEHYDIVLAQHVDAAAAGSTTGFIIPELLRSAGIAGSIINHSEHRLEPKTIREAVVRLRECGMISVVCAKDANEAGAYAKIAPDYVAIEPPELIGSGRSVSTYRPTLISEAARIVREAATCTLLLCGAGISTPQDVSRAIQLGSAGILVASGIVKSKDPAAALTSLAGAMVTTNT